MNVHQSAVPVLIVLAPLLTSFVLPVLGWWYRPAVFPVALTALAVQAGFSTVKTWVDGDDLFSLHYLTVD